MTLVFIAVNLAYIALVHNAITDPWPIFFGYLLCLGFTLLVMAGGGPERYPVPRSRWMVALRWLQGLLRQGYPLALFTYFFMAVTRFDTALWGRDLDPYFAAMDTFLFGSVPSARLLFEYPSFLLSEVLHGAYVLYYVSIPGLAIWLYIQDRNALREYIVVAMLIFYAACLTYAVLPVVGGRFDPDIRALTETYRYGPFTRIMVFIYRSSAHTGAAFPSTHAIMSLVIALMSIRRATPLALLSSINAGLILAATVYCGYHYVVDLVAAFVYLAILYPVGLWMESAFYRGSAMSGSSAGATSSAT
jgi:membrane-associated phospholipid phosphatase